MSPLCFFFKFSQEPVEIFQEKIVNPIRLQFVTYFKWFCTHVTQTHAESIKTELFWLVFHSRGRSFSKSLRFHPMGIIYGSYDSGMLERHLTNVKNIVPILLVPLKLKEFFQPCESGLSNSYDIEVLASRWKINYILVIIIIITL